MLGSAAKSKPFVREALESFAFLPLDMSKPKNLVHRDFIDRLEVFEYVSRDSPERSLSFLKKLGNKKMRIKFATHFIIGRKMHGKNEEEAFQELKAVVADL
jgi:hypothetical protein